MAESLPIPSSHKPRRSKRRSRHHRSEESHHHHGIKSGAAVRRSMLLTVLSTVSFMAVFSLDWPSIQRFLPNTRMETNHEEKGRRALSNVCDESKMKHVKLSNGGTCTPTGPTHIPTLHDRRSDVKHHYQKHMTLSVHGHDREAHDLPTIHRMFNASFAIWDSQKHYTEASAWTADGHVQRGPGWLEQPRQTAAPRVLSDGDYVGFTTWFAGVFGHHYDDHLPTIAYLRTQVPQTTKFLLLDTKLGQSVIRFLDPEFYERVVWLQEGEVVHVSNGYLYVTEIHPTYPLMWGCNRPYDYLRGWIQQKLPMETPDDNRTVLFYSRSSSDASHGRVLDKSQEKEVLERIKSAMVKHNRPEKELVVFTGQDPKTGKTMPVEEQFALFRRARTIIGPHGAGMLGNLLWVDPTPHTCANRVQVLEFIPGVESTQVQPLYHSLHMRWRVWPVDFHVLLYTHASTPQTTRIRLEDLDDALDEMWTPSNAVAGAGVGASQ